MTAERALRFNELIKEELGKILLDFLEAAPGILVTITRVVTTSDMFHSAVFISVYPMTETGKVLSKLSRHIYEIQQLLNKKLKIRPVPKIRFINDKSPEEAAEIEKLLKNINE